MDVLWLSLIPVHSAPCFQRHWLEWNATRRLKSEFESLVAFLCLRGSFQTRGFTFAFSFPSHAVAGTIERELHLHLRSMLWPVPSSAGFGFSPPFTCRGRCHRARASASHSRPMLWSVPSSADFSFSRSSPWFASLRVGCGSQRVSCFVSRFWLWLGLRPCSQQAPAPALDESGA